VFLSERRGGFEVWSKAIDTIFIMGFERKGVCSRPKVGEAVS
jgi:hypothetical protein